MKTADRYLIKTRRLGLRPFEPSDENQFYRLNSHPEVMRNFPAQLTKEENKAFLKRVIKHYEENGFSWFAVELLEDRSFMGFIGIVHCKMEAHFTPCIEIGWRILPDYWGKGYASEGAKACLDFAFSELSVSEIYSFTATINKPSEKVMQRIGMSKIGEFAHPKLIGHALEQHVLYHIKAV